MTDVTSLWVTGDVRAVPHSEERISWWMWSVDKDASSLFMFWNQEMDGVIELTSILDLGFVPGQNSLHAVPFDVMFVLK